jgi:hypothetical protein
VRVHVDGAVLLHLRHARRSHAVRAMKGPRIFVARLIWPIDYQP